jgi:hypothetical protein
MQGVDEALKSLTLYMMIGIVIVIGVSQVNRIAGGILGVLFWTAVAIVGSGAYDKGGGIGLPGFVFPLPLFYTLCVVFALMSGVQGWRAYEKKRKNRQARSMRNDD